MGGPEMSAMLGVEGDLTSPLANRARVFIASKRDARYAVPVRQVQTSQSLTDGGGISRIQSE